MTTSTWSSSLCSLSSASYSPPKPYILAPFSISHRFVLLSFSPRPVCLLEIQVLLIFLISTLQQTSMLSSAPNFHSKSLFLLNFQFYTAFHFRFFSSYPFFITSTSDRDCIILLKKVFNPFQTLIRILCPSKAHILARL